jgi:hypothetical protein
MMFDGGTRFVSDSVDLTTVWRRIGNRQDGEVVGSF